MPKAQHPSPCKVYLHPMTCSRPSSLAEFQRRTGLRIVATANGNAQAVPARGGAA